MANGLTRIAASGGSVTGARLVTGANEVEDPAHFGAGRTAIRLAAGSEEIPKFFRRYPRLAK